MDSANSRTEVTSIISPNGRASNAAHGWRVICFLVCGFLFVAVCIVLTSCNKPTTHDLKTEAIAEAEIKATFELSFDVVKETLRTESMEVMDNRIRLHTNSYGSFKYPKDMAAALVLFVDPSSSLMNNPKKQKVLEESMRSTARIMSFQYKDKGGKEREVSLEDFDVSFKTLNNFVGVFVVPTAIRISSPQKTEGSTDEEGLQRELHKQNGRSGP
jgi:hypothetical protein